MSGQYADKETNLHYNSFRDYDPAIGRYVQSDPIGLAGGISVYLYVGGNPLGRVDPPGLDYVVMTGMMNAAQRGEWPNWASPAFSDITLNPH